MRMRGLALVFALIAGPVAAEDALTIEEFEAAVTGKRIAYYDRGQSLLGIEQYSPGRIVRWAAPGQVTCMEGIYYAKGDWICFDYPDYAGVPTTCGQYRWEEGRLTVRDQKDPVAGPSFTLSETTAALGCAGPDLGA